MTESWLHRTTTAGRILRSGGCHPGVMLIRRGASIWLSVATRWEKVHPDNDDGMPS